MLSDYREKKAENEKKREVYHAIYEDLMRFYNAGKPENEKGFIIFF